MWGTGAKQRGPTLQELSVLKEMPRAEIAKHKSTLNQCFKVPVTVV